MDEILLRHRDRMLLSGVSLSDFEAVLGLHPEPGPQWSRAWTANAERHLERAAAADADRFALTAAQLRARAAANLHWAQFILYQDPVGKSATLDLQAAVFLAAAPNLAPAVSVLDVATEFGARSAYLALPSGGREHPIVILVPGLDSTKEELYGWTGPFLERGWGVALFDGPGVGQLSDVPLTRAAMASAIRSLVDALAADARVDARRIVIAGANIGGLMATLTLAADSRIAAGAAIGAAFDTAPRIARLDESGRRGFLHVTHASSMAELERIVADWSADGLGEQVKVPLAVVYSDDDPIIGVEHAQRYAREFGNARTFLFPNTGQGCYREGRGVLATLADWLDSAVPG